MVCAIVFPCKRDASVGFVQTDLKIKELGLYFMYIEIMLFKLHTLNHYYVMTIVPEKIFQLSHILSNFSLSYF